MKELEKNTALTFLMLAAKKTQLERRFKKVQNDLWFAWWLQRQLRFLHETIGFNPFDFQAAPCAWFDVWWMFGVKDGFDIVIEIHHI